MNYLKNILFLLLLGTISCQGGNESLTIYVDDQDVEYSGRIHHDSSGFAELYWSGSSVKIHFEGTGISALMHDEYGSNYYNVIVDNDSVILLRLNSQKNLYRLVSGLPHGKHSVELFKRTEFTQGATRFYGFNLPDKNKLLPKSKEKEHSIEFYGNSITAGYAIEDTTGLDRPDSVYTNNYLSYSALTARYFNANYSCICKSGIGVTVSWAPDIMPDIYDRLNPVDGNSKWDFSYYTPDVVVVNLMQNDYWLTNMPNNKMHKLYFKDKYPTIDYVMGEYTSFIKTIRSKYPDAHIICMLGNMSVTQEGSEWPKYVLKYVNGIEDSRIYTLFIPFKNTKGHPNVQEQKEMSEELIELIEEKLGW